MSDLTPHLASDGKSPVCITIVLVTGEIEQYYTTKDKLPELRRELRAPNGLLIFQVDRDRNDQPIQPFNVTYPSRSILNMIDMAVPATEGP